MQSITLPFIGQSREASSTSARFGYIFGTSGYTGSYLANGYYLPSTLTEVIITDTTNITSSAFHSASNLTRIVLPNNLTSIGSAAFTGTSSLVYILIPNGVTTIGAFAFTNAINLSIYAEVESQPEGWDSSWNGDPRPVYWIGQWQIVDGIPTPN